MKKSAKVGSPKGKKIKEKRTTVNDLALMVKIGFDDVLEKMREMDQKFDKRFQAIEEQLVYLWREVRELKYRMIEVEKRLDKVEQRLDKVEQRLDKVEQRLDKVEQRLDKVEYRLTQLEQSFNGLAAENLPRRVAVLEGHFES
jgi:chromosome segregation ATPase